MVSHPLECSKELSTLWKGRLELFLSTSAKLLLVFRYGVRGYHSDYPASQGN